MDRAYEGKLCVIGIYSAMASNQNPDTLYYLSGIEVQAGDLLVDVEGQESRVVVVINTGKAVEGYDPEAWAYLGSGVLVEHRNASGVHLAHYPKIDEDFELLRRTK